MGVTCHYMEKDFTIGNRVLAMKHLDQSQTAAYLFDSYLEVLNYWNLQDKVTFKLT
jgi:hypothetical protein